jgi:hypothetical protein
MGFVTKTCVLAIGLLTTIVLSGCGEKQPESGRYCSEKTPANCMTITFAKKYTSAEVKVMDGVDVAYEGKGSFSHHILDLDGVPKGPYQGNLKLNFDSDDLRKFELSIIGSSKPPEPFIKK